VQHPSDPKAGLVLDLLYEIRSSLSKQKIVELKDKEKQGNKK